MARQVETVITCDRCGTGPANHVTVNVSGLPKAEDGKRKPRRKGQDLCGDCADQFDAALTAFVETFRAKQGGGDALSHTNGEASGAKATAGAVA